MACTLTLLPTLLTESSVTTLSSGKGRKRSFWKPTLAESMAYFVDIQKVGLSTVCKAVACLIVYSVLTETYTCIVVTEVGTCTENWHICLLPAGGKTTSLLIVTIEVKFWGKMLENLSAQF
jgi:hypothetical protein